MFQDSEKLGPLILSPEELNFVAEYVYNQLIQDRIRGQCLEFHRAIKQGYFFLDESGKDKDQFQMVDKPGVDIFGQVQKKKHFYCPCPICTTSVSASRFASHLANCMGLGRNSSRLASERIAKSGKEVHNSDNDDNDNNDNDNNDNDSDWNSSERKSTKKKKDKNVAKRTNRRKGRNGL